jgi:hypothetical protein
VQAESSGATAYEGASREVAQPQGERPGGEGDDPRRAAFERRIDGDEPEGKRERSEEET